MDGAFPSEKHDVSTLIPTDEAKLQGNLNVPPGARGLVLSAQGSGSSRRDPRNRYVASAPREGGLATLLMNRRAFGALHVEKDLEIIPGTTHLLEEPATLEQVARSARV